MICWTETVRLWECLALGANWSVADWICWYLRQQVECFSVCTSVGYTSLWLTTLKTSASFSYFLGPCSVVVTTNIICKENLSKWFKLAMNLYHPKPPIIGSVPFFLLHLNSFLSPLYPPVSAVTSRVPSFMPPSLIRPFLRATSPRVPPRSLRSTSPCSLLFLLI